MTAAEPGACRPTAAHKNRAPKSGSGDATGVMLFENVPQNVKHVAGPALEFEIGTLHPNETRDLDLVLTAEKAGKVVNTLTAKADGNLQVQQQVEFEVIAPELTVAVDGPERRYLERPATYEVTVENPGTAPAQRYPDCHQAAQGHAVRPREQHGRIRRGHARRLLEPRRTAQGRTRHGRARGHAHRDGRHNA